MRKWYVLYTKPRQEKSTGWHLERKGLLYFLPMICNPWEGKGKAVEPLFPSYLFVHLNFSKEFYLAAWTPGAKRFVTFGEEPTPIDDGTMAFLMEKTGKNGIIEARSSLKPGDEITISGGPFEGLAAIIKNPPDRKGRVQVLMNILRQQTQVDVPIHWIKSNRPLELIPQGISNGWV
jgi:transcriptional antiterminator RfaH